MKSHSPDYILIATIFILVIFGLVMVSSASIVSGEQDFGEPYYYFRHQVLFGAIPGIIFFLIAQKIGYRSWRGLSFILLIFSFALLVMVFIPDLGYASGEARRWLAIQDFSFQPAELAKLSLVLYLAAWFEKRGKNIKNLSSLVAPFIVIATLSLLIILQPNIGTLGIILLTALVIFFVGGARLYHIILLLSGALAALFILIRLEPYRMNRLSVLLSPELDPQGIGYQINQILLALGSGGLWGLGLGHSVQKYNFLPEAMGDSIAAVIGEELGFIGFLILISLFLLLAIRGIKISLEISDIFGKLVAIGIISWIIFQAFINIAAVSALIPLTGIPLPLISYGGTSLAMTLLGLGILVNISRYT